jgi:hypothetical protein
MSSEDETGPKPAEAPRPDPALETTQTRDLTITVFTRPDAQTTGD